MSQTNHDGITYKTDGHDGFQEAYKSYKKTVRYWLLLLSVVLIIITSTWMSTYISMWYLVINLLNIIPAYLMDKDMERYLNKRGFTLKNNK